MIVLIGFMAAGKTTVGRMLADELDVPFRDSDAAVVERDGRSIADIFATDGEAAFRRLERDVVAELLAGPRAVLALGGGAVEDSGTRALLRDHTVVHLDVSLQEVAARVGDDASRPVLADPALQRRYRDRRPQFLEVADVVVPTGGRTPFQVAAEVVERLSARA